MKVARRGGFTLIEILVVLTIIILIAAAAAPAFRFITGSRSIEGTQNIIASMLSRARNQALADGETRGVLFFLDPVNDRTTMAIVGQTGGDFDQYHGWTMRNPPSPGVQKFVDAPGNTLAGAVVYSPSGAGIVQSTVISNTSTPIAADLYSNYLGIARYFVKTYYYINAAASNSAQTNEAGTAGGNAYWGASTINLNLVDGTDFQILPQGVGVQLINSNPTGANQFNRYVRIGCIMFDRDGRFVSVPWSVKANTPLGNGLRLANDLDLTTNNGTHPLYSEFGLVLYDRQTYLNAVTPSGAKLAEGDWIFGPQAGNFFQVPPTFPAAYDPDQKAKEAWLDGNSLPLILDRHNGSLIKGE